ncbi:MAG: DUF2878 domain-containing protein [Shewanella algae]|uniref:DUF2878 domain-containing protein n=1 Tax=Shewanella algae TaxID=38313 RepID=UPI000C3334D1|nr:DUF2878 domain-containing protein [Shewanella algae]MBO2589995.1 DUF2878 domain-containing protein [Shewanella algae]MBO2611040.1 DUF2878 domain-containing protein [Shewanella algae]MBO2640389.1 DUF2878 domain-containing protein [Shewanella algae]MBO2699671.1 DUF2878 domain-containing protein [Shewanella algae]MDL2196378.1 DUF2878 domain-containing protein [Shewanella algae]
MRLSSPWFFLLLNAAIFQLGWWSLILFANQALVFALLLLCVQLLLVNPGYRSALMAENAGDEHSQLAEQSVKRTGYSMKTFNAVLIPAVIGIALDAMLHLGGVFEFDSPSRLLPLWLCCLWGHFAATLGVSLAWLRDLPKWQQALFGAVGGAGSYLAAFRLEAVAWPLGQSATFSLLILIWSLLLPLLSYCNLRLEWGANRPTKGFL